MNASGCIYTDANGLEINVGDCVKMAGWPWADVPTSEHTALTLAGEPLTPFEACGRVTAIDDPDGDVDDEGRSVAIPPRVSVRFDDGTTDRYSGHWLGSWGDEDAPFEFEDLERIP
jgi:hypothetical protein